VAVSIVDRFRAVPLFSSCSDDQLRFIATQVEEMDFPAGRVLCRQGASGGEFFILLTGAAEVRRDERPIRRLGPGDYFGEIALLEHGPRSATVETTAASRCLVLSQSQFKNVLAQDKSIALNVLHTLASRLRGTGAVPAD